MTCADFAAAPGSTACKDMRASALTATRMPTPSTATTRRPRLGRGPLARLSGDWRRRPVPPDAVEAALRRAIEEAAPDLVLLDVVREGAGGAPSATGLVQIDLKRSRHQVGEFAR